MSPLHFYINSIQVDPFFLISAATLLSLPISPLTPSISHLPAFVIDLVCPCCRLMCLDFSPQSCDNWMSALCPPILVTWIYQGEENSCHFFNFSLHREVTVKVSDPVTANYCLLTLSETKVESMLYVYISGLDFFFFVLNTLGIPNL